MLDSTKSKLNAAESFLKSIQIQLSIKPQNEAQHRKFLENDFLDINTTCYFLNSVVFELIIKMLWELDKNKKCYFTHDLKKLFSELSKESQLLVVQSYSRFKSEIETAIKSTPEGLNANIKYCDLNEALALNETIIKDFKYEMNPSSKNSVFNNIVSTDEFFYAIPFQHCKGFFETLFSEIRNRL